MTDDREPKGEGVSHGEQRCDFCGEVVPRVQRIALDGDYERLRTPHAVQFAAPAPLLYESSGQPAQLVLAMPEE